MFFFLSHNQGSYGGDRAPCEDYGELSVIDPIDASSAILYVLNEDDLRDYRTIACPYMDDANAPNGRKYFGFGVDVRRQN